MQIQGGAGVNGDVVLAKSPDLIGDALSIGLSQQTNSVAIWTILVFVKYSQQGLYQLGRIVTVPPGGLQPASRIVGFAFCPGAKGWIVRATCPTAGEVADLEIDSSKNGFGVPGVTATTFT